MVCHCLLIETARDGLILVDSGFSLKDVADPTRVPPRFRYGLALELDAAETAVRQVVRLGYGARDVRHVVVTHLDLDHAGGLVDFPDATVHVHDTELRHALTLPSLVDRQRYIPAHWAHRPKWHGHAAFGDTWRGLAAISRLPGVDADVGLVPLPGHSRGHTGVIARAGDRWLVHAGDAYFHPRALVEGGVAPWGFRLFEALTRADAAMHAQTMAALRRLRADPDIDLFCAHEPGELAAAQARAAAGAARRIGMPAIVA